MTCRFVPYLAIAALLVGACSDRAGADTPTVALDASELDDWERTASEFFDQFYEGWPDLEARFSAFADDAVFYDPTFGDYWIGPQEIIAGWGMMPSVFPDLEAGVKSLFLSAEGAAFDVDWIDFWPGEKPSDVPWPAGLEVFSFDDTLVASEDLWYTAETLEGPMNSCGGCTNEIQATADSYVTAWSSGDTDQIAALYSADATLSDSLFGVNATGPEGIAQSRGKRFGSGEIAMTVEGVYGVALNHPLIGPGSSSSPGDITGVGVRFMWNGAGEATTVESLALVYFGSVEDGYYQADNPGNLILREEVFHNPDTLTDLIP